MKTIEDKLYKFEELSEAAQQAAIQQWRDQDSDNWSLNEIVDSLKAFAEAFNINLYNYSLCDYSRIDARLGHIDDEILELSGARLVAYIYNNYKHILYERRGYRDYSKLLNGKWDYKRRSRIKIINTCCPFTGVCFDEDILDPIRNFMLKPGRENYEDLLQKCISAAEISANNAVDWENSSEYISETIIANDYDFTEKGKRY